LTVVSITQSSHVAWLAVLHWALAQIGSGWSISFKTSYHNQLRLNGEAQAMDAGAV